jgi:hypothetical protein
MFSMEILYTQIKSYVVWLVPEIPTIKVYSYFSNFKSNVVHNTPNSLQSLCPSHISKLVKFLAFFSNNVPAFFIAAIASAKTYFRLQFCITST